MVECVEAGMAIGCFIGTTKKHYKNTETIGLLRKWLYLDALLCKKANFVKEASLEIFFFLESILLE